MWLGIVGGGGGRKEAPTSTMHETRPEITNLDSWFASISPDHLASFTEVLLIVGEDDEIVEGRYGISPWENSACCCCRLGVPTGTTYEQGVGGHHLPCQLVC
jgi:hypothetical protein